MKLFISVLLLSVSSLVAGQPRKAATMAPIMAPGYYVSLRGDTVWGEVQTNPPAETDFHKHFGFKKKQTKSPKLIDHKKAKAYGFNGRHFVIINYEDNKVFAERLVSGRLRLYQFRYSTEKNDETVIQSVYFIKDTQAGPDQPELSESRKISEKFYKKNLKPYMQDQPVIWSDLDKYHFSASNLILTLKEFNKFYPSN